MVAKRTDARVLRRIRWPLALALAHGAFGCSSPGAEQAGARVAAEPVPAPATRAPAVPSAASNDPSADTRVQPGADAEAAPQPVAVVPAKPSPERPPRKRVTGRGISITETSDGRVQLQTTTTWGEALDTTYTDCRYYRDAIPVLVGQLSAKRAKLLARVCVKPAP